MGAANRIASVKFFLSINTRYCASVSFVPLHPDSLMLNHFVITFSLMLNDSLVSVITRACQGLLSLWDPIDSGVWFLGHRVARSESKRRKFKRAP